MKQWKTPVGVNDQENLAAIRVCNTLNIFKIDLKKWLKF